MINMKEMPQILRDLNKKDGLGLGVVESLETGAASIEQVDKLQKAFALICRFISDEMPCPAEIMGVAWLECEGETGTCGDFGQWECWQRYFRERVESEQVCRVCGCTQDNACPGGCSWVEEDLCSCCTPKVKK